MSYGYDGVGNVTSLTNTLDATDSKTMTYDGLDRLRAAGTASVAYDAVGNITSFSTSAGSLSYSYNSANRLSSVSGRFNRSFAYDEYGNVTSNGVQSFIYDDAGNLRSVGGIANYDYDGKNLRVRAVRGGVTTHYFYGRNGQLLGEYDTSGNWTKEYVYLGNKLVATVENVPDAAPSPPATISVPASSSTGSYAVSWSAATANGTPITRYELQEATDSGFTTPVLVYSGLGLSFSATNRANGTYYYRVRACSGTACSNYTAGANGVTVP